MESDLSSPILHQYTPSNTTSQMPQTPEPSPFKRPAMSFSYSPRPDSSSGYAVHSQQSSEKKANSPSGILSPPPSPSLSHQISEAPSELGPTIHNRDPVLYDTPASEDSHHPLFDSPERSRTPSVNSATNVAAEERATKSRPAPRLDASLPKFKSTAWQDCFRNPSGYFQRERAYLRQQAAAAKANRIVKPVIVVSVTPKPATPARKPQHSHQRSRSSGSDLLSSPRERVRTHKALENSRVSKPKFSRQSKPVTTTKKDIHYSTVDDFTPDASLLPDNPRCLHVDWSGAPLDISNDPDRHLLHKAEQHLASTLKLSCGQYLTQKRLIFNERVTRLRAGNPVFSRTHAQQVCHIDVNKASRLFAAFEKVGWLSPDALKQHL